MKRIDIDEAVQPRAATVGQTFLRAVVGVVMAGHGVEKLIHLRTFQGELIQVGVSWRSWCLRSNCWQASVC
jgi:hypothetical protein